FVAVNDVTGRNLYIYGLRGPNLAGVIGDSALRIKRQASLSVDLSCIAVGKAVHLQFQCTRTGNEPRIVRQCTAGFESQYPGAGVNNAAGVVNTLGCDGGSLCSGLNNAAVIHDTTDINQEAVDHIA